MSTENSLNLLKFDLHTHTKHSDGHLTVEELVTRAHNMQVDVLAITDHDTVAGLETAHAFQSQQKRPMHIVNGVELSTRWHGFDIHIVGLNIDIADPVFQNVIRQQHETRSARAVRIAEKLASAGIEGVYERVKCTANGGQITRSHYAKALVAMGAVNEPAQAFKKWLGKGKRAHVVANWISIEQAVEAIQRAGGKAVLAHPTHYDMTTKWLRRLIAHFDTAGGDGVELNYPNLTPEKQKLLVEITQQHGLCGSVGSDFHFPSRWTELGRRSQLPDEITPIWHDWHHDERFSQQGSA